MRVLVGMIVCGYYLLYLKVRWIFYYMENFPNIAVVGEVRVKTPYISSLNVVENLCSSCKCIPLPTLSKLVGNVIDLTY